MSMRKTVRSKELYERALESIPGGASSASRTPLEGYDPYPIFIERAEGSKLYDADGNEYIDYLQALGPMFAGHANPRIIDFVTQQIKNGSTYGLPFELQIAVAEKLIRHVPCFEKVSFMNSGSEVVQEVMRLARAYTGRKLIVKYEGNYHGCSCLGYRICRRVRARLSHCVRNVHKLGFIPYYRKDKSFYCYGRNGHCVREQVRASLSAALYIHRKGHELEPTNGQAL